MEILYAQSDDVSLAYAIAGEPGLPVIFISGIVSNLALDASNPNLAAFYERLARIGRFVRWDRRGTGLSDQSADPLPLLEQDRDLEAIRRAVGFERFALVAFSQGTGLAVRYAAENPERVSHLVLINGVACNERHPGAPDPEPFTKLVAIDTLKKDFPAWISGLARTVAPSLDAARLSQIETLLKASVNPKAMRLLIEQIRDADQRPLLPKISVPTLVIHATRDRMTPIEHGRCFAENIPGARLVEIDTDYHVFFMDPATTAQTLTALEEFLTGSVVHTADRIMTSVLFTDIVDSSAAQQRLGDEAWRALRKSFQAGSRRIAQQFGGRIVEYTGDGVMAAFPAASEALRAAHALAGEARALGVEIRAGVHSGEAYTVGDQLFGTCVTVAARVAALAGGGELYTTETVQDLVSGSDFRFRSVGRRELKGIGERSIVAVD